MLDEECSFHPILEEMAIICKVGQGCESTCPWSTSPKMTVPGQGSSIRGQAGMEGEGHLGVPQHPWEHPSTHPLLPEPLLLCCIELDTLATTRHSQVQPHQTGFPCPGASAAKPEAGFGLQGLLSALSAACFGRREL